MIALLLTGLASAAEPSPATEEDFRSYVDQARFFLRKEWYDDAAVQLERAVATEDGRLDPEAWFLLAKVLYELGEVGRAWYAADRALVNSRDPQQTLQTRELLEFFEQTFGFVTVTAPHDGIATRIDLQLTSTIYDPELKAYFHKAAGRLERPVVLPYDLGLPAGTYTVNGTGIEVVAGARSSIEAPLDGAAPATLQVVEIELGLGTHHLVGAAVRHLLPAPTLEASVGLPVGPLRVGVAAAFLAQPYAVAGGGLSAAFSGVGAGVRVGVEVPGTQPLVLRPSLSWRVARSPAMEVACAAEEAVYLCARDALERQVYVYTPALTHLAALEVTALYQDRRRRSGLGVGLTVAGGAAIAYLPKEGTAQGTAGEVPFETAPDADTVTAGHARAVLVLSYAL